MDICKIFFTSSIHIASLFQSKQINEKYFDNFLICVFVIAIVLSGNRVPLVMFLLIISAITILKTIKEIFFYFFILALSIFSSAYYLNDNVKMHFYNFSNKVK